jgi:hypothetical protein
MTAVGNFSDTKEIIEASWSNFQPDGAAAFQLSEISPLPPALSTKDLPGRQTQVSDVHWIRRINNYSSKSDEYSTSESISNTKK